jgi:N-acetylglutamate synthase-like GNAT family acetyltransferase
MTIRTLEHNSTEYEQMIQLRISALLMPIGVSADYIQKENESQDILIGAFESETLVGCCNLTPVDNKVIQLRQMIVEPAWQGKNIGAAIVAFAEKTAKERGFTTLIMHARNPAIGFYTKAGYKIVGTEFYEVGIGHHKMEKQL